MSKLTTAQAITINNNSFTSVNKAEKYIDDNQLNVESNIDLQEMINNNSTLVECEIINPENKQHIITCYIDSDDVEYETSKIQLTITSRYNRGFGKTKADVLIDEIKSQYDIDGDRFDFVPSLTEEILENINNYINQYNQYGDLSLITDGMTVQEIIDILL